MRMDTADDVVTLYYRRGEHHYIVMFTEPFTKQAVLTLWRWAEHPHLTLSVYDAAKLTAEILDPEA